MRFPTVYLKMVPCLSTRFQLILISMKIASPAGGRKYAGLQGQSSNNTRAIGADQTPLGHGPQNAFTASSHLRYSLDAVNKVCG